MIKKLLFVAFIILACNYVYSQQKNAIIQRNDVGIVTKAHFIVSDPNMKSPTTAEEFFRTYLNLGLGDSFEKHILKSHNSQTRHELYEQYYKGIKVVGGSYVFHYKNEKLTRVRGEFIPIKNLNTSPSITKEEAALAFAKHEGIPEDKIISISSELLIMRKPSPSETKPEGSPVLTYKIYLSVNNMKAEEFGYIDAHNGTVYDIERGYDEYIGYGTLETIYSGDVFAYTRYYNGKFYLVDSTRNAIIHTWDLDGNTSYYYRQELTDYDNYWQKLEHSINRKYVAHDVHWALQEIYDALYDNYSRDSYDDQGKSIDAYINYGGGIDNACWLYGPKGIFISKDTLDYRPFVSLDMIAHEFGHGITYYNIGWGGDSFYANQTSNNRQQMDALSEGLSDIWAVILKYKITGSTNGIWQVGADVVPGVNCLRNIQYPNVNCDPMATSYFDYNYIHHSNSSHVCGSVFSRWFYLLAMGGTDTNSLGYYYNVNGIGLDNAAELVVNAIYEGELYQTKNFQEVRDAFMDIAMESGDSDLINSIANAWHAVGVGGMNISLSGPQMISSHGIYTIEGLPNGYDVVWSLSDYYYNYYCIQQATPAYNKCTIIPDNTRNMENATLTATIKCNGDTVQFLTKSGLYAYKGFKGTYSSSFGSGQYTAPNPIFTTSNSGVHISSPNLIGSAVTYSGDATPYSWLIGYNTIDVGMPSTGSTIVINVLCEDGTQYYIPIIKSSKSKNMTVNFDGEIVNVMLDESNVRNQTWTVEIINVVTGEKAAKQMVSGKMASINMVGLERGIYVVRVMVGNDVMTEKIQLR